MEILGLIDIPLWLLLILCSVVLLYIYGTHPLKFWHQYNVPTPPGSPFVGHMFTMYDPNKGMQKAFGEWIEKYGKCFGIIYFRDKIFVISSIDAIKQVLVKDFNNYTDRYILGQNYLWPPTIRKGLFFNEGEDWRRIRRIMSSTFSSGKLKMLTHHINTTAGQLADALEKNAENGTHPDAKFVFSAFSLDVIAGTAFGLDLDSQNNENGTFYQQAKSLVSFSPYLKILVSSLGIFPYIGPLYRLLDIGYMRNSAINYFEEQLTKLVQIRKDNPEDFKDVDFLQFLINAEADEEEEIIGSRKLTTKEIVAQGIIFVLAGYETTSTTLQWLCYELAKSKGIQEKMREEIEEVLGDELEVKNEHCQKLKYMEAVINESLRMYTPVINISRLVERTTSIEGHTIPAGTGIIIPIANVLRNPELFEDPDCFKPERFLDEENKISTLLTSLPFGFGPRQCIGLRLAMLQLKIALVHVLRRVTIEDTQPRNVEIDDFTGLLVPKELIKLVLNKK